MRIRSETLSQLVVKTGGICTGTVPALHFGTGTVSRIFIIYTNLQAITVKQGESFTLMCKVDNWYEVRRDLYY
jgi:hypothetical protein